jgi:hypothetical protein
MDGGALSILVNSLVNAGSKLAPMVIELMEARGQLLLRSASGDGAQSGWRRLAGGWRFEESKESKGSDTNE